MSASLTRLCTSNIFGTFFQKYYIIVIFSINQKMFFEKELLVYRKRKKYTKKISINELV